MADELRKRRTQTWGDLNHIPQRELRPSWPDPRPDPVAEEKATSVFTVRLGKRDRDRLEKVQATLGTPTLNRTIKALIRSAHAAHGLLYSNEVED